MGWLNLQIEPAVSNKCLWSSQIKFKLVEEGSFNLFVQISEVLHKTWTEHYLNRAFAIFNFVDIFSSRVLSSHSLLAPAGKLQICQQRAPAIPHYLTSPASISHPSLQFSPFVFHICQILLFWINFFFLLTQELFTLPCTYKNPATHCYFLLLRSVRWGIDFPPGILLKAW